MLLQYLVVSKPQVSMIMGKSSRPLRVESPEEREDRESNDEGDR